MSMCPWGPCNAPPRAYLPPRHHLASSPASPSSPWSESARRSVPRSRCWLSTSARWRRVSTWTRCCPSSHRPHRHRHPRPSCRPAPSPPTGTSTQSRRGAARTSPSFSPTTTPCLRRVSWRVSSKMPSLPSTPLTSPTPRRPPPLPLAPSLLKHQSTGTNPPSLRERATSVASNRRNVTPRLGAGREGRRWRKRPRRRRRRWRRWRWRWCRLPCPAAPPSRVHPPSSSLPPPAQPPPPRPFVRPPSRALSPSWRNWPSWNPCLGQVPRSPLA